jgi:DNA modification methylase
MSTGPNWTLHRGDCLQGLATLPDLSVDVTLTDPPYSRDLYSRHRSNKHNVAQQGNRMRLASNSIGAIDDMLDEVAAQLLRVTRRWIVVFSDQEITHRWRAAFAKAYVRTGIWVKPDAMPQVSGDRPAQGYEAATIAHGAGERLRWNGGGRPAVWVYATCHGLERADHPSPKPLALMRQLVADFSDAGEIILDPFAGSGTTGAAALRLGRRFIGWELAACSRCASPAEWRCSWLDKKRAPQMAYLCDAHRDEVATLAGFDCARDNYHEIACRRLRGDEARPRKEQPGLFDALQGAR